ncbi:MAG: MATE family efflux transporter, partial [Muribaculaceae bacterium]|nr:MATE family efflux transporter [Muribaculaceae bacterium]
MLLSAQYKSYYKRIIQLGLPILVGQLGMIAVGFADNIMVGQHSTPELAAASFVNNLFNVAILMCIGFTYGLTPLIGALAAHDNRRDIGRTLLTGLKVNMVFAVGVTLLMAVVYGCLGFIVKEQSLLPLIRPYFLIYLAGMIPVALFNVFAQWSYGIGNTVMPTIIVLVSNVVNIIGNYMLIGGHWGCPEMGLTGAGLSTLVARVLCAVFIIAVFVGRRQYAGYRDGFSGKVQPVTSAGRVTVTSFPIALQMAMETGAFSGAAIIAGLLPDATLSLAAFQILVIVGTLGFCIYYSMGMGVTVLVSNAAGMNDVAAMRRIGWAGYHVILAIAACSCMIFLFFGRSLIELFSDNNVELTALAAAQIVPLLLYQLGDATQINFVGALRGTSRVMPVLWIAFVSYIVVGLPSTWLLALPLGLGLKGIYLSFSLSLFLAGALFLYYFLKYTRINS